VNTKNSNKNSTKTSIKIFEEDGLNVEYFEIDDLPTKFRYYDNNKVYVRGMYITEIDSISKFINNFSSIKENINQLVLIYKNMIKGINILELEYIDFLTLLSIISTITIDNFGWQSTLTCKGIIKNPKIDELNNKIIELTNEMSNPDLEKAEFNKLKDVLEKITDKLKNIEENEEFVECGYPINDTINLSDFEFEDPKITKFEEITIMNEKIKTKPILVKDIIQMNEFKSDIDVKYLVLASLLDIDKPLEEKIKYIVKNPKLSEIKKLVELEEDIVIGIKPIIKRCRRCGHKNKIIVNINDIKVYP